jgi:hypothetical protein
MHEVQLFSLVIGAGAVFVIFGVIQFFCQSLEVRPAKRQRIRPKLSSRKLVGSINVPGVLVIGLGARSVGAGHLCELHE